MPKVRPATIDSMPGRGNVRYKAKESVMYIQMGRSASNRRKKGPRGGPKPS